MTRVLAIINPKAGTKTNTDFEKLIRETLSPHGFEVQTALTQYAGHATELTKKGLEQNQDLFIAVGGDGTIHEVSKNLIGTNSPLAILPQGSGNGLARHLKIPLDPTQALESIKKRNTTLIDTGLCNGKHFLCTAGVGLEAEVAKAFAFSTSRGYLSYVKLAWNTFFKARTFNSKTLNNEVLNITIANCNQWGNNSLIAPKASIQDGLLDICSVTKMSLIKALWAYIRMYQGRINSIKEYTSIQTTEFIDRFDREIAIQIDGEFLGYSKEIKTELKPKSLHVVT